MKGILLGIAVAAAMSSTPALASKEANVSFVDVAATPTYRIEAPVKTATKQAHRDRRHVRREERKDRRASVATTIRREVSRPSLAAVVAALGMEVPGVYPEKPVLVVGQRPKMYDGVVVVAGKTFRYVSGGRGWSMPWGTWKVTPDDVGRWGSRHGAIGLAGNEMWDAQLGRTRLGVEIHASRGHTAGCFGIEERFGEFKDAVRSVIRSFGEAWLHVGPGYAAVTASRQSDVKIVAEAVPVRREARKERRRYAHRHHRRYAAAS